MTQKSRRIMIYGCAGSGKTTLALTLQKKLGLPLYHLDQYYWKPNWQKPDFEEFRAVHDQLCDQESWIIEGPYTSYLEYRIKRADTIIFLDMPRWLCLWQTAKRMLTHYGKQHESSPKGCYERFDANFFSWIWNYRKRSLLKAVELIKSYGVNKDVYILRSRREVTDFLKRNL